jgi:hypothetical protein
MSAIETFLFGLVAGLVGVKLAILAAAAVLLLYALTARARQRKLSRAPKPVRQRGLDLQA